MDLITTPALSMDVPFDGRADLSDIQAAAKAFERMYAGARYQDIPKAELAAQRKRDILLWKAARDEAYAISPAHGDLFDLDSRRLSLNADEEARCNRLWWQIFGLPASEPVAASNPIAA